MKNSREELSRISNNGNPPKPPMLVVHISKEEQKYLDYMQGGEIIDPSTGLKDYSRLDAIFRESKQARNIFKEIAQHEFHPSGNADEALREISDNFKPNPMPTFRSSPGTQTGVAKKIAEEGQGIDNDLALFPESLADFFDNVRGIEPGTHLNKNTGLRQYGFFKSLKKVFQVAAPIVGGLLGGPVGGAIGGALGGLTGEGNTLKNVLTGGALGGLGGLGAQGIGHMTGTSIGNMFPNIFPNVAASIAGAGGLGGLLSGAGSAAGTAGTAATTGAGTAAESSGLWSTLGGALKNPLTHLGIGAGLTALGAYQSQKERKKLERLRREEEEHNYHELNNYYKKRGLLDPLNISTKNHLKLNPNLDMDEESLYGGAEKKWLTPAFKKGGSVKTQYPIRHLPELREFTYLHGNEKGQDDNLYTDVPDGTYIIDASTTSDLGDGNSRAGAMQINKLAKSSVAKLRRGGGASMPSFSHIRRSYKPRVAAALSAGEVSIPPHEVIAIGHGSARNGENILKGMVKNIRKHKRSNPNGLPPKAKDIFAYLPKSAKIGHM